MTGVAFHEACLTYPGADAPSVSELELVVEDGEFLVLVGPSGCGKTSSLRLLAGLEQVSSGRIMIGDRDVTNVHPSQRDVAMVFQSYALYPHMSVADNMAYALKVQRVAKDERVRRVREAAQLLDLEPLLDRKPKALSGGQRQRVAMGRAIVRAPQAFLMDEPLSNLDAKLRVQTRGQITALTRRLGVTTVYVTHDQTEAMTMGDRIAVMADGVLQQLGSPRELYAAPRNTFVAGFIGSPAMNLLDAAPLSDGGLQFGEARIGAPPEVLRDAGETVVIGVRPEDLRRCAPGESGLPVVVDNAEDLGADTFVYGTLARSAADGEDHEPLRIAARLDSGDVPEIGTAVNLTTEPAALHLFDAQTGERLNGSASRGPTVTAGQDT